MDRLRKIYDELKVKALRQKKELDIMRDSIKDLELDSQRPHMVITLHLRSLFFIYKLFFLNSLYRRITNILEGFDHLKTNLTKR